MDNIEEKLNWIFTAFDADGGGSIDPEEITEIVRWMFRFAGIEEDPDLLASCVIDVRYKAYDESLLFFYTWPKLMSGRRKSDIIFQNHWLLIQLVSAMKRSDPNSISRATIDVDNDGDISQEEFIQNALNSSFIADIMKERESRPRKSESVMG